MSAVTAPAMDRPPPPPPMTVGTLGWLRQNLFSSWVNSLVTVVLAVVVGWAVIGLISWVIVTADWLVITSRVQLYLVGLYPQVDAWRPQVAVLLISALLGVSWRSWGGTARGFAVGLSAVAVIVGVIPHGLQPLNRILVLAIPVAVGVGYFLAAGFFAGRPRRIVGAAFLAVFVGLLIIRGIEGVPGLEPVNTNDVGGLLLNLLLALFGIAASMPIGIALALGRQSNLPVVKWACVAFIEIIRGVPLITLLFMSRHILPLTFPENIKIDTLYITGITIMLFSSAYMAENVRGGMAAVAPGQTEAARALGLRGWQTTLLITLPQGLRNIIPAIVGQFISLFKDTSLVFIIGMLDLVEMGRVTIQSNLEFVDNGREVYLFIAVVFWIFCFSMSYVSRRIERALGVGKR
ncbi:MAG: amino acid ABC transporter permease [Chloroflexi bacterium]|nr:amino acid ABC transporter permease [Chloroflexota bacterium]